MQRWTFEPGHTAAEFCVRHMMVTDVRGHFKNVHGTLEFDPECPALSRVEAVIDARSLWSGEHDRDAHLKSPDFLDVERFPEIAFRGSQVRRSGGSHASWSDPLHRTPRPLTSGSGRRRGGGRVWIRDQRGGVIVGDDVAVTIDAETILQS